MDPGDAAVGDEGRRESERRERRDALVRDREVGGPRR